MFEIEILGQICFNFNKKYWDKYVSTCTTIESMALTKENKLSLSYLKILSLQSTRWVPQIESDSKIMWGTRSIPHRVDYQMNDLAFRTEFENPNIKIRNSKFEVDTNWKGQRVKWCGTAGSIWPHTHTGDPASIWKHIWLWW